MQKRPLQIWCHSPFNLTKKQLGIKKLNIWHLSILSHFFGLNWLSSNMICQTLVSIQAVRTDHLSSQCQQWWPLHLQYDITDFSWKPVRQGWRTPTPPSHSHWKATTDTMQSSSKVFKNYIYNLNFIFFNDLDPDPNMHGSGFILPPGTESAYDLQIRIQHA